MMAGMRTMASPPIIPPTMPGTFERREGVAEADVGLEIEGAGVGNPIARSGLLQEHEISIIRKSKSALCSDGRVGSRREGNRYTGQW